MKKDAHYNDFDVVSARLDGSNLIEASAGTGKTFNIARIYLRLLLEKDCKTGEILVVTFTIAATSELRERIYLLLEKSLEIYSQYGSDLPDPETLEKEHRLDLQHAGILINNKNNLNNMQNLSEALRNFEDSSIYTIHGFCSKLLSDQAFETNTPFEFEITKDISSLVESAIKDQWRNLVYSLDENIIKYSIQNELFYDFYVSAAKAFIKSGADNVFRISEYMSLNDAIFSEYHSRLLQIKDCWKNNRDVIITLLRNSALSKTSYGDGTLLKLFSQMDTFSASEGDDLGAVEKFNLFSINKINACVTKNGSNPEHVFFTMCGEILRLPAVMTLAVLDRYLSTFPYIKNKIDTLKETKAVLTYDDLIKRVSRAAADERTGPMLQKIVSDQYSAALIDEFQDTDRDQWQIFSSLFLKTSKILFIIGDPKQSIYRFRGADINSYTESKKTILNRYTLTKNFRSTPEVLGAIDTIYSRASAHSYGDCTGPFLSPDIQYIKVNAGKSFLEKFQAENESSAPFQFLFHDNTNPSVPDPLEITAEHISTLLNDSVQGRAGYAGKENRALISSEIAVLVNTNVQAFFMQKQLRKRNINSILSIDSSVFETEESDIFIKLLRVLEVPEKIQNLTAALSTELFGWKADDIQMLLERDDIKVSLIYAFKELAAKRSTQGFMYAFQHVINSNHFTSELHKKIKNLKNEDFRTPAQKLLSVTGGERKIMNYTHLAELIQMQQNKTIADDINWFQKEKNSGENTVSSDDKIIRLESDRDAVQIITIHRSKGLEFPVVYLPTIWNYSVNKKSKEFILLEENDGITKYFPTGAVKIISDNKDLFFDSINEVVDKLNFKMKLTELEEMQEAMRLIYVALTRTVFRAYVIWGLPANKKHNAANLLFMGNLEDDEENNSASENVKTRKKEKKKTSEKKINKDQIMAFFSSEFNESDITVSDVVECKTTLFSSKSHDQIPVCPESKNMSVEKDYYLSSYTSLMRNGESRAEDYDGNVTAFHPSPFETGKDENYIRTEFTADESITDIFHFEKGAHAGIFLHKLLETVSFQADESEILINTIELLRQYGFDSDRWGRIVASNIYSVLNTVLTEKNAFKLSDIKAGDKIPEMPFIFPVTSVKNIQIPVLEDKKDYRFLSETFNSFNFSMDSGFLQGVADLIFRYGSQYYLLDWKSNHLGFASEVYTPERLTEAMIRDKYIIQYYLYITAVNQYLSSTLPGYSYEKNFGGVFYLFIRGMEINKDTGIFYDKPSLQSIQWFQNNVLEGANKKS